MRSEGLLTAGKKACFLAHFGPVTSTLHPLNQPHSLLHHITPWTAPASNLHKTIKVTNMAEPAFLTPTILGLVANGLSEIRASVGAVRSWRSDVTVGGVRILPLPVKFPIWQLADGYGSLTKIEGVKDKRQPAVVMFYQR